VRKHDYSAEKAVIDKALAEHVSDHRTTYFSGPAMLTLPRCGSV
jgi:hypothetical protein